MYRIIEVIAKSRSTSVVKQWSTVDITNIKLKDLYLLYSKIYVILEHNLIAGRVSLDLDTLKTKLQNSELTLKSYISSLGNTSLPTSNKLPSLNTKTVRYIDGFRTGFKYKPVNAKKAVDADLPLGDKESLWCTKDGVDCSVIPTRFMANVNGYWHYIEANKAGYWIVGAMASQQHCKLNYLGLLDFKDLGKITHIKITRDMLFKLDDYGYRNVVGVKTKLDLNNKTVLLVLGGYLHLLQPKVFYTYNDNSILIQSDNLPLLTRFQEANKYLDFSYLPFTRSSNNPNLANKEDFLSDANLEALLTGMHSYLVVLDNSSVYTERIAIRTPPTPNLAISFIEPKLPLIHGLGKVANYWSVEDKNEIPNEYLPMLANSGLDALQYALYLGDNQWSQLVNYTEAVRDTQAAKLATTSTDQEIGVQPVHLSRAYYLNIASDFSLS